MRGKLDNCPKGDDTTGITPACAGKTLLPYSNFSANRDHPRVCGENLETPNIIQISLGSPPRVRGKLNQLIAIVVRNRITPACAGKTGTGLVDSINPKDHPRVCGENGFVSFKGMFL